MKRGHSGPPGPFGLALGIAIALLLPATASAHSELKTSVPADGATVPSPFDGPIVLTFSETLADGSKADLHGRDGAVIASATVDGPGATETIVPGSALPAGQYQVKWVSVADDGDLLRGTITFTVAAATPSPAPTPEPTPSPRAVASETASAPPPTASSAPSASGAPSDSSSSSSSGDVVLPIVIALIVVGAGAAYLLTRRNRPTTPG